MTKAPIPSAALDDRLGFTGTAGSGKTYGAGTCVERLLDHKARVLIPDPLGVWYGLRLEPGGKKPSGYDVVIFGGPRGDLPINEHAGALIGETCAGMAESAIIDISEFGTKAAERRFMLAFLIALYRHANKEPVHLIFDEADMWAPERLLDKEGEAAKLLGTMETIVRRGRVKGFIPWLITQRPAVLSKNVLSQVDGLVSFKLTSSQDRKALGAWIEAQADREEGKRILGDLPTMQMGQAVVWLPTKDVLTTVQFPEKKTFDSSRTPKRGEKRKAAALTPLDLPALRDRLASVEAETKANDPKILKQRIRELEKAQGTKKAAEEMVPVVSGEMLAAAEKRGRVAADKAIKELRAALEDAMKFIIEINAKGFFDAGGDAVDKKAVEKAIADATQHVTRLIEKHLESRDKELAKLRSDGQRVINRLKALIDKDVTVQIDVRHNKPFTIAPSSPAVRSVSPRPVEPANGLTRPHQKILDAIAWFEALKITEPTRAQVAAMSGYSPTSGGFYNLLGQLNNSMIQYPRPGLVALTDQGRVAANPPDEAPTNDAMHRQVFSILKPAQKKLLAALLDRWPDAMNKDELANAVGYSPTSGGFFNLCGRLRTLGLVGYPRPGEIRAEDILFPENRA